MSECTHKCQTCGQDCAERTQESLIEKANKNSKIGKVIGIVSGKAASERALSLP
jgi:hypothetical protein